MSTILVGIDASERSEDAVAFARELARTTGARVLAACAFAYDDRPVRAANAMYRKALQEDAEATLARLTAPLEELGADRVMLRTFASTSPARALQQVAEDENAAVLVVGSSHTGQLGRVMPGSTGERLLQGAPCAVVVVPRGYRDDVRPLRRIGVAADGSPEADAAVRAATALVRAAGGELTVLTVEPDVTTVYAMSAMAPAYPLMHDDLARAIREVLDRTMASLGSDIQATGALSKGDVVARLEEASAELDLLVAGSRGYGPLRSVLLGGVTGRLVRVAHAPVLVVPRGVEAPLGDLVGEREGAAG